MEKELYCIFIYMKLLLLLLLLPCFLLAQGSVLIKKKFLDSDKTEKEYWALMSDTSIMHGLYKAYHYNGKLFLTGEYQNGKREGEWTSYHENGKVESRYLYCNGAFCGMLEYYSSEGILESSFNMSAMDTSGAFDAARFTTALQKVLQYPEKAHENDIQGVTEIMILKDSSCHLVVQLAKGFNYDCDKEAMRAVKQVLGSRSSAPCKNEMQRVQILFRLPE